MDTLFRRFASLGFLVIASCDGGSESTTGGTTTTACIPGQSIGCTCSNGQQGAQICNEDGTALGMCTCTGDGGAGGQGGSQGGGGGTAGAGGGTFCEPGSTKACYSGPTGTAGVGVCIAGIATCLPDGSGHGGCVGEVLPAEDLCSTPVDEDCDGSFVPCVGAVTWSKIFPTMDGFDEWFGLEADGAGNVIVGLRLGGQIDLGGGPVANVVVAKFDAAGNHLWSKGFGGIGTDLAVDANGNVVITGYFGNLIDLGGGVLLSQGAANDVFVAKYSPSGQHLWSKRFGGNANDGGEGVAVDADGNVIVVGAIANQADFGGGTLPFAGNTDFFALKLDPDGNHLWSKSYGDLDAQFGLRVATDPASNVIIGGRLWGSADFGGGALVASPGGTDVLAVKLDPGGDHLWSKRFGDNPSQRAESVAVDSLGNVLLAGYFAGNIDFGGGTLFAGAEDDGFVVKLAPDGSHVWEKHITGAGAQGAYGVEVGGGDTVVVTGSFFGAIDLGGLGSMVSAGASDVFAAKLAPDGAALWQKKYGDGGSQAGMRAAVDPAGAVLVGGSTYQGAIDFGDGPLASFDVGGDLVLGKLPP